MTRLLLANIPLSLDRATSTSDLREGILADSRTLGYAFSEEQFQKVLAELHKRQHIFVFKNGFVSWTEFGKRKHLK